jgi:glycosyltransferase involved in cell wall biosynthesis
MNLEPSPKIWPSKNTMPKLSIIIPCYNSSETLREAVASCYLQGFTVDEFEIILVDDASKDTTKELMGELASEYKNIRLFFHDQNQGGGATRNTAAREALASVIFCLDSDDLLPRDTLDKMFAYLQEKNCDAVCFHHSINFIGSDITNVSHGVTMVNPGEKIVFTDLFQTPEKMCALYQVFMITKSAFALSRGYPTTHGFDTQGFAWRFLAKNLVAYTCPDTTYLLRVQFKESYYLREYNSGKTNFNWQAIFIEHLHLFTDQTQEFILNFDCQDFTRDIFAELQLQDKILRDDYKDLLGKTQTRDTVSIQTKKPLARNSLFGFYLRVKNRLSNL